MTTAPLSTLVAFLGALLGALVVVLVVLRVLVKRATEEWARDHWEQHAREILEVEQVAAEVVAEDEAKARAEAEEKEKKDERSPEEIVFSEPVSEGPPDEDPAERRKRERRERAARIRERIRKRRIGERLMGDGPSEAPATYGGRPKAVEESTAAPPAAMPRRRARGAAAWGAATGGMGGMGAPPNTRPTPSEPPQTGESTVPGDASSGIGVAPLDSSGTSEAAMPSKPRNRGGYSRNSGPPRAAAEASDSPGNPPEDASTAPMSTLPTLGGGKPSEVPPAQPEGEGPVNAPTSASPPKKKRKKPPPKKRKYNPPPDISTLPEDLIAQIKDLDAQGRTILANKTYRQATGTSFRDAEKEVKKILAGP